MAEFKVSLSFKDEATGRFIKATEEQINAVKKAGIAIKKETHGMALDLDKMAKQSQETGRHMRFLGMEIGKLAGSIGSIRNTILVYMFMLRPLINLIKESSQAYIEQEDAIKRINFSMGLQNTYSHAMGEELIKLSKSFQSVTRYGDEAVLQVMEKLVTIGNVMPAHLKRATQATLDFASATGRDLSTAADIMAKAASGYTGQLARYGIIIDKNIPKTRAFAEVLGFIEKNMGKRAQADVESMGGKMAQYSNVLNDLKENIGSLLAKWTNLGLVLNWYKEKIAIVTRWTDRWILSTNQIDFMKKQVAALNRELEDLATRKPGKRWFVDTDQWQTDINRMRQLVTERDRIVQALKMAEQKFGNEEVIAAAYREQEKLAIREQFEERYKTYQRQNAEFRLKELQEEYATYKQAFEDNKEALLQIEEWYKYEKDILDAEILKQAKKHSEIQVQLMQAAATGMRDAISNNFIKVIKGDFAALTDMVRDFGNIMLESIARIAITGMFKRSPIGGFIGVHSGGYIMGDNSYGHGRKKYHSGGEVDATLLEGEYVLNRNAVRNMGVDNLDRLNRGETGSGTIINNYYIQTIDERSFRERLQQHGDIYSNATDRSIKDNTSLRKTSQRFG